MLYFPFSCRGLTVCCQMLHQLYMLYFPFSCRGLTVIYSGEIKETGLYFPFSCRGLTVQPALSIDTLVVRPCFCQKFQIHRTPSTVIADGFSVCMVLHWLIFGGTPPYYGSHYCLFTILIASILMFIPALVSRSSFVPHSGQTQYLSFSAKSTFL